MPRVGLGTSCNQSEFNLYHLYDVFARKTRAAMTLKPFDATPSEYNTILDTRKLPSLIANLYGLATLAKSGHGQSIMQSKSKLQLVGHGVAWLKAIKRAISALMKEPILDPVPASLFRIRLYYHYSLSYIRQSLRTTRRTTAQSEPQGTLNKNKALTQNGRSRRPYTYKAPNNR
eukprot:2696484-Pleurochrysis_carterae.AAC.2